MLESNTECPNTHKQLSPLLAKKKNKKYRTLVGALTVRSCHSVLFMLVWGDTIYNGKPGSKNWVGENIKFSLFSVPRVSEGRSRQDEE